MMLFSSTEQLWHTLTIFLPLFVVAISIHECAHAAAAYAFGDTTARDEGRLTINPVSHIDPFGLVMMLLVNFGWARPVPVDESRLQRWQIPLVSAAGPLANLALAIVAMLGLNVLNVFPEWRPAIESPLVNLAIINVMLLLFNLLPIPPLDGAGVLRHFLPPDARPGFDDMGRFSFILIFVLFSIPDVRMTFWSAILWVTGHLHGAFTFGAAGALG